MNRRPCLCLLGLALALAAGEARAARIYFSRSSTDPSADLQSVAKLSVEQGRSETLYVWVIPDATTGGATEKITGLGLSVAQQGPADLTAMEHGIFDPNGVPLFIRRWNAIANSGTFNTGDHLVQQSNVVAFGNRGLDQSYNGLYSDKLAHAPTKSMLHSRLYFTGDSLGTQELFLEVGAPLITTTLGDANQDGRVNNLDLATILAFASGTAPPTEAAKIQSDFNGDGIINSVDLGLAAPVYTARGGLISVGGNAGQGTGGAARVRFGPVGDTQIVDGGIGGARSSSPDALVTVYVKGDMNGDGAADNSDISALVLALVDPAAYQAATGLTDGAQRGDADRSGGFDNDDILPFVSLLTGASSSAVPEPATAVLAFGGLVTLAAVRLRRR